jgi:Holliday junction resolvasome RuvABC ATP-dependent DNA helicase subunit
VHLKPQVKHMERHEINDVAPTAMSHIIGQKSVMAQVAVALEAAFADGKRMDDCLLVGGSGLGKTQIAKVIAAELASDCHEVLGQAVQSSADLNAVLLAAKDKDVVFFDESTNFPKNSRRLCTSPSTSAGSSFKVDGRAGYRKASRWRVLRICCPRPTSFPSSNRFEIA